MRLGRGEIVENTVRVTEPWACRWPIGNWTHCSARAVKRMAAEDVGDIARGGASSTECTACRRSKTIGVARGPWTVVFHLQSDLLVARVLL